MSGSANMAGPETRKQYLMNRINWITYLKILYDQLEKIKEPLQPKKKKKSFLSDTMLSDREAFSTGSDN